MMNFSLLSGFLRSPRLPVSVSAARTAGSLFALGMVAAAIPGTARAEIVIDNPGTGLIQGWGNGNSATTGQVITAPTGSTGISSFTFTLTDQYRTIPAGPGPVAFKAYVYAWDNTNSRITGDALFSSAIQTTPDTTVSNYPDPITIDTTINGGTPLTAGSMYVLFFSTSGLQTTSNKGQYIMYGTNTDTYTGGKYVYMNNANNFSALSTTAWTAPGNVGGPKDLRFTAVFVGVAAPEPGSLSLLGMTLVSSAVGIGIRVRRPRRMTISTSNL